VILFWFLSVSKSSGWILIKLNTLLCLTGLIYQNHSSGLHLHPMLHFLHGVTLNHMIILIPVLVFTHASQNYSLKWTGSDAIMLSVVVVGLSSFSEALMASFQINLQQPLVVHFLQSYEIRPIPRGETS